MENIIRFKNYLSFGGYLENIIRQIEKDVLLFSEGTKNGNDELT